MVVPCKGPRPALSTFSSYLSPAQEICTESSVHHPWCTWKEGIKLLSGAVSPYTLKRCLSHRMLYWKACRETYLLQKGVSLGIKLYAIHEDPRLPKPAQIYIHTQGPCR